MAISHASRIWRGRNQVGSSNADASDAAPIAPVVEEAPPAAPEVPRAEEDPPVADAEEEETDDTASDDSRDSYTARDGRHFHWKFIAMEKQYFQATKENVVLKHQMEETEAARTATENRASELEARLIETEANVAGNVSLAPLFF